MNDMTSTIPANHKQDKGFTLVEILIAIVVVGILAAVAIIGISSLTSTASNKACTSSSDAAKAAASAYYAANGSYPSNIAAMLTGASGGGQFTLPSGVTGAGSAYTNGKWTLTLTGTGPDGAPIFTCS